MNTQYTAGQGIIVIRVTCTKMLVPMDKNQNKNKASAQYIVRKEMLWHGYIFCLALKLKL